MGEGKGPITTATEESKALLVEVYNDGGRPAVKAIGDALGSIARLAVGMFRALSEAGNVIIDRFQEKLTAKLKGVPPERQQLPAPTIAGPALMQVVLLGPDGEVEQLREMFANLLATAMDRDRAAFVHPSFVSIVSQLTPDEARLLKSIKQSDYAAFDVFEHENGTQKRHLGTWTLLGRGIGLDESRLQQYVSNLDRLGILRIDDGSPSDHSEYKALENLVDAAYGEERNMWCHGRRVLVTPLGEQFLNVCVRFQA